MYIRKIYPVVIFALLLGSAVLSADVNTNALLTDTRVVYIYDQSDRIDWPLVYYLAVENGCQVDLATVKSGPVYKRIVMKSERHNITLSRFFLPEILYNYLDSAARELFFENLPDTSLNQLDSAARELYREYLPDSSIEYLISLARDLYGENLPEMPAEYLDSIAGDLFGEYIDSVAGDFFGEYRPDIVIFASAFNEQDLLKFENYLLNIESDTSQVFNIKKYFRRVEQGNDQSIYFNAQQYFQNHQNEISEMAAAVSEIPPPPGLVNTYTVYDLIEGDISSYAGLPDFLSGIEKLKFNRMIKKYINTSIKRKIHELYQNNYVSHLKMALHQKGLEKIESMLSALGELEKIRQAYYYQIGAVDTLAPIAKYIEKSIKSLSTAIFREAGIDYRANIEIRDTPEGKRLKFKSVISNNGSLDINAGWLEFNARRTDTLKIIDSNWANVNPNNTLVRDYTIDIDPKNLETINADSLLFTGRVRYAGKEVTFVYSADAHEESPLSVEFVPDFLMIKPFKKLKIDRLIEAASLKAIIRKPTDLTGLVKIKIDAPPGIFTGAFAEEITLESGQKAIEMEIPLVMTKSAGKDKQEIMISVIKNGKIVASDIANIRQAEFSIPANLSIALFPDNNGLLEDILIETGARYRIISERYLAAGDFNYYDVLLFGTNCFHNYQALEIIHDKVKKFMEYGGTVIVFGQPDDWRDDLLPVSIISTAARLSKDNISFSVNNHTLFSNKYKIEQKYLLGGIHTGYVSYPAVVFPCKKIIKGDNNTTILSETKLGKGSLIYCGLPLPELIRELDIDAIKLYSNLIHYAR